MEFQFDALAVQPSTGAATFFPLGDYPFRITAVVPTKVKESTNNPPDWFLAVTLSVIDGPFAGCHQVDRFNLGNTSAQAVQIAHSQLSSLCRSIGVPKLTNTDQLIGGMGIATIGPQANSDKYSEVKQYKDIQGRVNGEGAAVAAPQVQAPVAAAPAPSNPFATATSPAAFNPFAAQPASTPVDTVGVPDWAKPKA